MSINIFADYPLSWRPDKVKLRRPFYLSLVEQLKADIKEGKLLPGTRLPSQRELADFLDIGFSTVTRAYKLSQQQGITYGKIGQGTFIAHNVDIPLTITRNNSDTLELGFISSYESTNILVEKTLKEISNKRDLVKLLNYDSPTGLEHHKLVATRYLRRLGINSDLQNTVIVSGGENALTISLLSLFKSGDRIAVDHFTYANFIGLAQKMGIKLVAIKGDRYGMIPQKLKLACQQQEIKGIYLMPNLANPTALTISKKRRYALADMIKELDLILLEDDYLSFFDLYQEEPLVKLSALVPAQSVYIASMSKPLVSGLRVAFLCFSEQFKSAIEDTMFNVNVKTSSLGTAVITRLLENGQGDKIMQKKLLLAKQSNAVFDEIFSKHQTDELTWSFFRTVSLKQTKNGKQVEQYLLENGIRVFHSDRFIVDHYHENEQRFLRVALSSLDDPKELAVALQRLKKILYKAGEL